MAKTLIVKGADFSNHYLEKVSFGGIVPCEDISFDSATLTLENFTPTEIEYTLTPSDTTDEITWASSDTDVATVTDGIVTAVGLGTCTITATCGEHSATATVNVSISLIKDYTGGSLSQLSNHMYYTANDTRVIHSGIGNQASEYDIDDYGNTGKSIYPFLIPKNATKIRLTRGGQGSLFYSSNMKIRWFKNESCGDHGNEESAKFVSESTETINFQTTETADFIIPNGVNAFAFFVRAISAFADASTTGQNMDIGIEFLAE